VVSGATPWTAPHLLVAPTTPDVVALETTFHDALAWNEDAAARAPHAQVAASVRGAAAPSSPIARV